MQKIGVAEVTLSEVCVNFSSRSPTYKGQTIPTAGFLAPILGGLLGDVAGAGLNAVATALETASQERAIGAAGRANFEFYTLDASKSTVALPTIGYKLKCLTLVVPGDHVSDPDGLENWLPADYRVDNNKFISTFSGEAITDDQRAELEERFALKNEAALRLEAEIVLMRDGFYIRPVYIHYATRLDGAPANKALPAELHVNLATPSSVKEGAAAESVFAIARIPLPRLKPGDTWWAEQIATESGLLPFRADDGTTAALKLALDGASARSKAEEDKASAQVQIAHAIGFRYSNGKIAGCVQLNCPPYLPRPGAPPTANLASLTAWAKDPASKVPEAILEALDKAEIAYAAAVLAIDESASKLNAAGAVNNETAGSTTLEARIILTKSQNKFELAVAGALKKQEEPVATAISGAITKDDPKWTEARSNLALAKLTVIQKEAALGRTNAGGDAEAIEQAQYALLQAKLDVNLKAAALNESIPYPELGY